MKNLIFMTCALILSGCTASSPVNTVVCKAEDALVAGATTMLVTKLACANADAVKADVQALVAKANLCKPADGSLKGPIGNLVCGPVVDGIVGLVQGKVLPAAWGCTGGIVAADAKAQLLPICQNAI